METVDPGAFAGIFRGTCTRDSLSNEAVKHYIALRSHSWDAQTHELGIFPALPVPNVC